MDTRTKLTHGRSKMILQKIKDRIETIRNMDADWSYIIIVTIVIIMTVYITYHAALDHIHIKEARQIEKVK